MKLFKIFRIQSTPAYPIIETHYMPLSWFTLKEKKSDILQIFLVQNMHLYDVA